MEKCAYVACDNCQSTSVRVSHKQTADIQTLCS
jgi:hypothetical protein